MPPKGYSTLTVRADVVELLVRAKRLFHKSQIQILLEAISEYIGRHYEYGTAVLSAGVSDAVAVAWSAGVFEASGVAYPHPAPEMKIAVEVVGSDRELLNRLKDIWGGTLYKEKDESEQNRGETWVWGLRSEKAKRFLDAILPYLKGSKSRLVKDQLTNQETPSPIQAPVDGGEKPGTTGTLPIE